VFLGFLFLLLGGCGRDNAAVVDFERVVRIQKPSPPAAGKPLLRIAVGAMISPQETFASYRNLLTYIGRKTGSETELIQRKTYREVNELLGSGRIDVAFICSGPYVGGKEQHGFELLAVPQIRGACDYRAYLIVRNETFHGMGDLRGGVFAFTDPQSNTGRLVPAYWLKSQGEQPEKFFSRIVYTHSHNNSIHAVSRGLVDGASVHSLIWEHYLRIDPSLASTIRVIRQSESYPIPPVVASSRLDKEVRERVTRVLLSMHEDPEGRRILEELEFDRFVDAPQEWFAKLARIEKILSFLGEKGRAIEQP